MIQPRDAGQPPVFEKIAILGLGLIGGSIALAARQTWPSGLVIAVDNKDVLEQAMVRHAIDVAADEPYVIAEADLVILAAPVRQNLQLLNQLEGHIEKPAVVTDVGGTKRAIVEAARAAASSLRRRRCSPAARGSSRPRRTRPMLSAGSRLLSQVSEHFPPP